eukprot:1014409-Prorocentrum_minimum.AAC.1
MFAPSSLHPSSFTTRHPIRLLTRTSTSSPRKNRKLLVSNNPEILHPPAEKPPRLALSPALAGTSDDFIRRSVSLARRSLSGTMIAQQIEDPRREHR